MPHLSVVPRPTPILVANGEFAVAVRGGFVLRGDIAVPPDAWSLVVVPHALTSPRGTPYNRAVAGALNRHGIATVVLDCLASPEKVSAGSKVGVATLSDRLIDATQRSLAKPELAGLPVGYMATSRPGCTVALRAAGKLGPPVGAVVSVGVPARRDILAGRRLSVPVLLIGDGSREEYEGAAFARRLLGQTVRFEVIPGAESLGRGDPGPHKRAFSRAADWFAEHLHES